MKFGTRQKACPTCGAPAKGGLFCSMCGSRLEDGAAGGSGLAREWSARYRLADVRDRAVFALGFLQTWSGARRQLGVIDAELRRLHGERKQQLLALGEAAYRSDEEATEQVRDGIRALDEQIEQEHEKQRLVVAEASRRIDHEHEFVAPTQIVVEPAEEPKHDSKESS